MTQTLISLKKISFTPHREGMRDSKPIIYDIDLSIEKGTITTLIGPNGAGKTTLLKIILGLLDATGGHIERASELSLGYVPQKLHFPSILPLRVIDFLALTSRDKAYIQSKLDYFHLTHLMMSQMHHLSGGELQKILLIQATLHNPNLLILDEPTQGVDMATQGSLYAYIETIRQKTGCAILLVSHDLHMVLAKSDAVLCLNHHICCQGHPEDVRKHPEYIGLFGGDFPSSIAPYHHHHDHTHDDV